jgi:hypothetical protein
MHKPLPPSQLLQAILFPILVIMADSSADSEQADDPIQFAALFHCEGSSFLWRVESTTPPTL